MLFLWIYSVAQRKEEPHYKEYSCDNSDGDHHWYEHQLYGIPIGSELILKGPFRTGIFVIYTAYPGHIGDRSAVVDIFDLLLFLLILAHSYSFSSRWHAAK